MLLKSQHPRVDIPDVSLAQFMRSAMQAYGERLAYIDGATGRAFTFAQVLEGSARIANALVARGLAPQERVAFVAPNSPEFALAFHGVVGAGGVAMMLNPLSTAQELRTYFDKGRPRFVVTVPQLAATLRQVAPELKLITLGGPAEGAEELGTLLEASPELPKVALTPARDVAAMPFSSGTTGFPKGVMLTHSNIVAQCLGLASVADAPIVMPDSHVIAVLPFFHIYGIIAFLTYGPAHGATTVTVPRFDMAQYLELVRKYEVPILHIVPPILLGLAKYPGELDIPSAKAAIVGAAPLSAELAREFSERTGAVVGQVYGMTEVTGASHLGSRVPGRNKPGSIGGLVANVEARIVSTEDGRDLGPNERGELWVRGPIVMQGYFDDLASTAATIDSEGWLHTGDVGYVDADGDFWLVDRVKELIKYKGLQVAPAELEAVLLTHPAVADAAVFPQPDEEAGEIPKAAIVLRQGEIVTAEALMSFVQERVSPQKRVREVVFVEAIPKSASGKILRRMLRGSAPG